MSIAFLLVNKERPARLRLYSIDVSLVIHQKINQYLLQIDYRLPNTHPPTCVLLLKAILHDTWRFLIFFFSLLRLCHEQRNILAHSRFGYCLFFHCCDLSSLRRQEQSTSRAGNSRCCWRSSENRYKRSIRREILRQNRHSFFYSMTTTHCALFPTQMLLIMATLQKSKDSAVEIVHIWHRIHVNSMQRQISLSIFAIWYSREQQQQQHCFHQQTLAYLHSLPGGMWRAGRMDALAEYVDGSFLVHIAHEDYWQSSEWTRDEETSVLIVTKHLHRRRCHSFRISQRSRCVFVDPISRWWIWQLFHWLSLPLRRWSGPTCRPCQLDIEGQRHSSCRTIPTTGVREWLKHAACEHPKDKPDESLDERNRHSASVGHNSWSQKVSHTWPFPETSGQTERSDADFRGDFNQWFTWKPLSISWLRSMICEKSQSKNGWKRRTFIFTDEAELRFCRCCRKSLS